MWLDYGVVRVIRIGEWEGGAARRKRTANAFVNCPRKRKNCWFGWLIRLHILVCYYETNITHIVCWLSYSSLFPLIYMDSYAFACVLFTMYVLLCFFIKIFINCTIYTYLHRFYIINNNNMAPSSIKKML